VDEEVDAHHEYAASFFVKNYAEILLC